MDKYLIGSVGLIAILALIVGAYAVLDTSNTNRGNGEWVCAQAQCTEYLTGQEWVDQYCLQDGNETVCPIQVEGQQVLVPLPRLQQQVNFEEFQQCVEARCVGESYIQSTNYSIDLEGGLGEQAVNNGVQVNR